ncbi:MAG TPA: phosphate ABC transporter substrate-binding protein PstS [Bacteroidales bacterium]|nr:phosphate ABC transporter substrate-binding protein PstS [Bacteroidales bacterium]HOU95870.1 phosphate ABC transporter substrate-binding protein PstS [Bacteroidales bacterium]HQG35901.1 phosphate ABC transporter substrate-binding protein PstS [Bacteroidales bacterium]HQG52411.1 phosphate ABC transporter substrate-binding protein PstS [Bacteroidales bacterium]HQJ20090.1 phosphate ABC transporter substrate-binding protein PstS [Bacteroidales bacterium]
MKKTIVFLATIIALAAISCGGGGQKSGKAKQVTLSAAGATFPQPFYNLAFRKYSDDGGSVINYGGIGSGGGIRSLRDQVVDFGVTDAFLSDAEMAEMPRMVVHIPTCIGAVVIAYNLPGVTGLKLTPELLAGIFLGNIKKWNDPEIARINPDITFPDMNITIVYRSDGSGTTYIFSDYMSKVSPLWKEKLGTGKALNWTTGIGAKGNPGVAGTISQSQGTIGYIGFEYAFAQRIPMALIMNSSGNFIEPTLASFTSAANVEIPDDTRVMITNSPNPDAYPITSFTWIILYKEQAYANRTLEVAKATVEAVRWLTMPDAQAIATSVHYASLPQQAVEKAEALLRGITYEGKPVLE